MERASLLSVLILRNLKELSWPACVPSAQGHRRGLRGFTVVYAQGFPPWQTGGRMGYLFDQTAVAAVSWLCYLFGHVHARC
jgi:hypothetical protein